MRDNRPESAPYALSSNQMNIWNAEKAFSGTSINAVCATIRVLGAVDIPALQKALDAVVSSEAQLRARIALEDGAPKQYVSPYEHRLFPVFDFTKTDSTGLSHWEDTVAREPMKLIDAPLYDFRIFRQSESEGGILVKLHHIISDGWSQMLLSNRIAETYLALLSGREAKLVPGPSYELHVEKENVYLGSPARGKDEAFWRERLEGFEGASAVKDCLSADVSPVGRRKTFRLSHMLNHLIRDFCEKYRVAPFAVYYMALAIYLNRATGARRLAIGVPVFNRIDYQEKSTLGMFVSTLPFLGEIDEQWSFARFNEELMGQWLELLRHQRCRSPDQRHFQEAQPRRRRPVPHRALVSDEPHVQERERLRRLHGALALQRVSGRASFDPPEQHGGQLPLLRRLRLPHADLLGAGHRQAPRISDQHTDRRARRPGHARLEAARDRPRGKGQGALLVQPDREIPALRRRPRHAAAGREGAPAARGGHTRGPPAHLRGAVLDGLVLRARDRRALPRRGRRSRRLPRKGLPARGGGRGGGRLGQDMADFARGYAAGQAQRNTRGFRRGGARLRAGGGTSGLPRPRALS